jgi:hypothetical protein
MSSSSLTGAGAAQQQATAPFIGLVVQYHLNSTTKHGATQTAPALIQEIHDDGSVRLCAFLDNSIRYERKVTRGTEPGQWNWTQPGGAAS